MAKKRPPKRKPTPQHQKGKTSKGASASHKQKGRRLEVEPLYGSFFEKFFHKNAHWSALGFISLILLIVFGDYLLGSYLYFFQDIGSDSINIVFANVAHRNDLLRETGFTSWSFRQGMGDNVGTWFSIDPFNWMNMLAGRESLPFVMAWSGILYLGAAGIFSFQYLKTVGFEPFVQIVGAAIYVFSGYALGVHSWYSFNSLILAAPLMLWGLELLLKRNNPIVLPIAIYLLAGPRLVTFGFFLIIYSSFRYFYLHGRDFKGFVLLGLKIGALSALGVLLASYYFGGTIMQVLGSARISGEASQVAQTTSIPFFSLNSYLINVTSILRTFATDMLGGGAAFKGYRNYLESPFYYIGTVSLLLIPQAIYLAKSWRKALLGGLLAIWLLIAILPYLRFAYFLFVTDHFRSFCLHFSLSFLFVALYALNKIMKTGKVHLLTLLISLVGCLALLNFPYFDDGRVDEGLRMGANIFLVLQAAILFLLSKTQYKYIGLLSLLLVLGIELSVFSYHVTHERDFLTKKEYDAGGLYNDNTLDALAFLKDKDSDFYRIQKDFTSSTAIHYGLNDALPQGFFSTPSYQSINNQSYLDFLVASDVFEASSIENTKWIQGLRSRPLLQSWASVKYVLRKDNGSDLTARGYTKVGGAGDIRIFENGYFIPFGFTYDQYFTESQFKQLPTNKKDISLLQGAVISDEDVSNMTSLTAFDPQQVDPSQFTFPRFQQDVNARKNGTFNMTQFEHDYLSGNVNFDKEKLLFFSIPFDKGWSMYVDGKEVEVLKVNIGFMGTVIPAGEHQVELKHSRLNITVLTLASILGLLLYVSLIFWYRRQRGK